MTRAQGFTPTNLEPLGDRAFLAHFATERAAAAWATTVRRMGLPGVTDVVLAYRSAAVFADPDETDLSVLETRLRTVEAAASDGDGSTLFTIPVLYDGPDLEHVALSLGLDRAAIIELHAGTTFDVFAIGFIQGFPYAGYLPAGLSGLARRDEPRMRVPAGSVAIAGRQTGIYPRETPGGWHLLGRTPLRIAAPEEGFFPIRAGDRIRFRSIDNREFEARRDEPLRRQQHAIAPIH
jgi:KipI family sensor histidine kinase inhibitor